MLTWKNNHKLYTNYTYQKHLDLQTGCVQHREELLGYGHTQEEENQTQTRLVGHSGKIIGNLLLGLVLKALKTHR